MKINIKNVFRFIFSVLFLFPLMTMAQSGNEIEMADTFRADGKIYVVIAVMAVILLGLILYLILIDRKVSRLEKKISNKD